MTGDIWDHDQGQPPEEPTHCCAVCNRTDWDTDLTEMDNGEYLCPEHLKELTYEGDDDAKGAI